MATEQLLENAAVTFTNSFYREAIAQQTTGLQNTLVSPLNLFVSLVMAWYVTDGKTRKEIAETLSLPKGVNDSDLLGVVGMSLNDLQTNGRVNISSANRMYLFGNFAYSKRLSDELQKSLHIGVSQYNKTVLPEKARLKINNWVAEKTDGLLTDFLPLGIINQDTRLILAAALYFTGSWIPTFDRSQTKDTDFFLLKGGTTKVPLMYREDLFKICAMNSLDAKVLKLPFADDRWDLFIILPQGKDDLPKVMQRYAKGVGLSDIISCDFRENKIGVYLPRVVLGTTTHVNATKIVQSLGIIEMFTKKANFSRLTGSPNVTASGVIHQCVMKVGEQGGAAPASQTPVKFSSPQPDIPVFRADHPFMVMVVYNGTMPVFVGHYVEPEVKSN